jgi:transposase
MRYIGVDLHTNSLTVCYLNEDGQEALATYALSELPAFVASLQAEDQVAVEATGNTRYFVAQVQAQVAQVVIVNPSQFEVIRKSVKKTDKNDARTLAFFLSKGMLPTARLKDEFSAQMNSLAQTRDKFVKLRTTLINKIQALHNGHGIKSQKSAFKSEKGLQAALARNWDEIVRIELEVLVGQIRSLNAGLKKLEAQMEKSGKEMPGYENLTRIKGIGAGLGRDWGGIGAGLGRDWGGIGAGLGRDWGGIEAKSAAILLSVIGDVNDFESEKKLESYFGVVPKVANSNETVNHGRITKRGSKLGRTTLVQCTLIAIKYSPYLRKFYDRKKAAKGAGKAIIATARKFLGIVYNTLKNNWMFEDFPNFVIAES